MLLWHWDESSIVQWASLGVCLLATASHLDFTGNHCFDWKTQDWSTCERRHKYTIIWDLQEQVNTFLIHFLIHILFSIITSLSCLQFSILHCLIFICYTQLFSIHASGFFSLLPKILEHIQNFEAPNKAVQNPQFLGGAFGTEVALMTFSEMFFWPWNRSACITYGYQGFFLAQTKAPAGLVREGSDWLTAWLVSRYSVFQTAALQISRLAVQWYLSVCIETSSFIFGTTEVCDNWGDAKANLS